MMMMMNNNILLLLIIIIVYHPSHPNEHDDTQSLTRSPSNFVDAYSE